MLPAVHELSPVPDPLEALRRFADCDGALLLESADKRPRLGRYSYLTADPFRWFRIDEPHFGSDPFASIVEALKPCAVEGAEDLPPFQGGAAGLLGYDLGRCWERLPAARHDEFNFPPLAVGLYDWVVAWDHARGSAWVICQGYPATEYAARKHAARNRLAWVRDRLAGAIRTTDQSSDHCASVTIPPEKRCPQFELPGIPGVTSTFTPDGYRAAIQRVIDYVRAGDVFQANLAQRLLVRQRQSPLDLYARLRSVNPAPFAAYFAAEDWALASASPERFARIDPDCRVEARPIKGTRPRSTNPEEDRKLRDELIDSEKDRAENVMIVDLLRNDLSKVCRPGSIEVPELCTLESYETVHHLVSAVAGRLEPGRTAWDLHGVSFPGGSITGAPKVRAMEIIHELEPAARGPYCGSLFYVGFDGAFDSNILIRTMAVKGGWIQFAVGGGVTARSDPDSEYDETLDKAVGMLRALGVPDDWHGTNDSSDR